MLNAHLHEELKQFRREAWGREIQSMPWTHAHPVAALPLSRFCPRCLNFPARVVRSMMPDFGHGACCAMLAVTFGQASAMEVLGWRLPVNDENREWQMRRVAKPLVSSAPFSLMRRWRSVSHACSGLRELLRSEHNARIHLFAAMGVVLGGWWVGLSIADWRWIAGAVALVWCAEALNTAFEHLCDVVSPADHPAVKKAKDIAAGAVLICAGGAVVIGCLTFWPYLFG
jgi:diacylglycerol kinase (ATP)